jgi:hypothetical protein
MPSTKTTAKPSPRQYLSLSTQTPTHTVAIFLVSVCVCVCVCVCCVSMCLSVIRFCFDCVRVFCAPDTKLGPRRGCTPRTKACFTKKVVKKKQNKSENCKRGGKCNTLCRVHDHHSRTKAGKKKERGRGRKILRRRQGEKGAMRMCETETASQGKASPQPKTPQPSSLLLPTTTLSLFLARKHFPSAKIQ